MDSYTDTICIEERDVEVPTYSLIPSEAVDLIGGQRNEVKAHNDLLRLYEDRVELLENCLASLLVLVDDGQRKILEVAASRRSADSKMRVICGIDLRMLGWSSSQWAALLKVTDAAIRKTPFWREDLDRAIAADIA